MTTSPQSPEIKKPLDSSQEDQRGLLSRIINRATKKTEVSEKKNNRASILAESSKQRENVKQGFFENSFALLGFGSSKKILSHDVKKSQNIDSKLENLSENIPKKLDVSQKKRDAELNKTMDDIEFIEKTLPESEERKNKTPIFERVKKEYKFFIDKDGNPKTYKKIVKDSWNLETDPKSIWPQFISKIINVVKNLFKLKLYSPSLRSMNKYEKYFNKHKNKWEKRAKKIKNSAKGIVRVKHEKREANKNFTPLMIMMGEATGRMKSAILNIPKKLLGKPGQKTWLAQKLKLTPKELNKLKNIYKKSPDKKAFRKLLEGRGFKMRLIKGSYLVEMSTRAFDYFWRPKNRQQDSFIAEVAEGAPIWGTIQAWKRIGAENGDSRLYQQASFAANALLDIAFLGVSFFSAGTLTGAAFAARSAIGMVGRGIASGLSRIGAKTIGKKLSEMSVKSILRISNQKYLKSASSSIFTKKGVMELPRRGWYSLRNSKLIKGVLGYSVLSLGVNEVFESGIVQKFVIGKAEEIATEELKDEYENMTPAEKRWAKKASSEYLGTL